MVLVLRLEDILAKLRIVCVLVKAGLLRLRVYDLNRARGADIVAHVWLTLAFRFESAAIR